MLELTKRKITTTHVKDVKVSVRKIDINKNLEKTEEESPDSQLAQQIKMTDDYKIIEKLQEHVRKLEKTLDQTKSDYEAAQVDLESTRIDLAAERQKIKRLQEQVDSSSKGYEINLEKVKNEMILKRQDDLDLAVEEERKRNELEFENAIKRSNCRRENEFGNKTKRRYVVSKYG